jgi:hypothetical protein
MGRIRYERKILSGDARLVVLLQNEHSFEISAEGNGYGNDSERNEVGLPNR